MVPEAPARPRGRPRAPLSRPADLPALYYALRPAFSCPRAKATPLIARTPDGHATHQRPRSTASRYARRGRSFRGLLRTARRCRRRRFSNCDVVGAVALLWSNNLKLSAGDNNDGNLHAAKKKEKQG